MKFSALLIAGAMALGFGGVADAANLLINGSFEGAPPGNTILGGGSSAISGWTTINQGVEWFTPASFGLGPARDGSSAVDLAWYTSNGSPGGGIEQTFATVAGQSYRLSFYGLTSNSSGRDGTAIVETLIDGSLSAAFNLTHLSPTWTLSDWQLLTQTFVASGTTTTLTLRNRQDAFVHFADVDGVSVELATAVPEPGTWAMMLIGFGLIGATLRRSRQRHGGSIPAA